MSDSNAGSVALPPCVRPCTGPGGVEFLEVASPVAQATIYRQGAHISTYHPVGQNEPVLFCSRNSLFESGKPIRGGVPVIFPWFGPHVGRKDLPAHGLVRTREWQLEAVRQDDDDAIAVEWSMRENEEMLRDWPHNFRLRYRLTVGRSLSMHLEVENTSAEAFVFEEALHTYLRVSDARTVSVRGFGGTAYLDKVDGLTRKTERECSLRLNGETDRIYLNTPSTCYIDDPDYSRTLEIAKTGSATTVLWNPWITKAAALADFGDDEWPEMICIETANAAQNALHLAPGERHEMSASVRVLPFAR